MPNIAHWFNPSTLTGAQSLCQKLGWYNRVSYGSRSCAWGPIYQNDPVSPTVFAVPVDLAFDYTTVVWPTDVTADDNPYGLVFTKGDRVVADSELSTIADIDIDGRFENYVIWIDPNIPVNAPDESGPVTA